MLRPFDIGFRPFLAVLAIATLLVGAHDAAATVINVTTTADEFNTDGDCSLREALDAANINAVRDACPAGSNAGQDEIVLAADGFYSLTRPFTNATANDGALTIRNDTPTSDLKISVAGTGTATISQDAVPDTRVIGVATGAHLDLEDVTITGGALTGASVRGAGILNGTNARLALLRCTIASNTSDDSGAGIRNEGALIAEDSAFTRNIAGQSGGAISSSSNTTVLITGSFFADNESRGQFGGGGAIESSDQISVVDSSFVNNRARTVGGAISHFDDVANQSSISQSCFVGNIAGFSGNAIDVFDGSKDLGAAGLWWGAVNGPSGTGPGDGDGVGLRVKFDPANPEPLAACLPMELVANGGFQSDRDTNGVPDRWTAVNFGTADGRACSGDACLVKMRGNGLVKRLSHEIQYAGNAGESLTFRARSRAKDVPAGGGPYRAFITIFHVDGSKQSITLNFTAGKHGFERLKQDVTVTENYTGIAVAVEYGRSGGIVRFDSVSVLLNP